jgi:hypothetical protein
MKMRAEDRIVVLPARGNEPAVIIEPRTDSDNGADYQTMALFILGVAEVLIVVVLSVALVKQQTASNKNRATIEALCATTTAIRNLDNFFLGLVPKKPPPNETAKARVTRVAFVKLVKADVARMAAAGDTCGRL